MLYNSAVLLLDIYARYMKMCPHKNVSMNVYISVIAKKCKILKCPSTDECMNKKWYILSMKYYLAIKRNMVPMHAKTWMNLDNILLHATS